MSAKADKGDRKREIEQSPMKKKFRDSAISSEELDSAIASRIELAFKEHQSTLNSVVNSAVRDAMDSVLIPALRELREDILATNKSVKELREEFEAIVTKTKQTPHIAIFLWPSSGPHNQLSLGPHTAMTYGPSVDQVWIPDKGHTWAITGPSLSQVNYP